MKPSRRVLDDRVLGVAANPVAIGCDELHVLIGRGAQLGLRADWHLGADGVLQVGIEPLVGIELGAVAGQEEDLDVAPALGQPGPQPPPANRSIALRTVE
jgi:hypothetical protein